MEKTAPIAAAQPVAPSARPAVRRGYYGPYGGQFVAETLMPVLQELERAFDSIKEDREFLAEYHDLLKNYVGRATPLTYAKRLSEQLGGAKIYLKREDLNHTGAHKVNNTLGQALLARKMGKKRVIAETGAGMHGVSTATMAALLGMECTVFMGTEDIERQAPNVQRMKWLGAEVIGVSSGTGTLKDAMNEAMRHWVGCAENTFYVIGTVAGPHPYPEMVHWFQSIIGREARAQILEQAGRLPDQVLACVGGGSNAIGIFSGFLDDPSVALVGCEAGGSGVETDFTAATLNVGRVGVLHGNRTWLMQDADGQIQNTHSISAGLDYPGVGPEHSFLRDSGRATYVPVNDDEAVAAFQTLCRMEGIIPALESAHAMAEAIKRAPTLGRDQILLVNLSGRGDKDMENVRRYLAARGEA